VSGDVASAFRRTNTALPLAVLALAVMAIVGTIELALRILEHAPAPRTTVQSPLRWSESAEWKLDYCNVARLTADEIARRRAAFDAGKAQAKALREESA